MGDFVGIRSVRQRSWASDAGIQTILYEPVIISGTQTDHVSPLKELFSDLLAFVSKDKSPETVLPAVAAVSELASSKELRTLDDDELRLTLSGHAKYLLEKFGKNADSKEYLEFLATYSSNIHQAWHVTSVPPHNKFYGYTVEKIIHSSNFSTIWEVKDASSMRLTLKILRIENLRSGPQIESFRRGVESQGYLTNAVVPGTARLEKAYEIPTSVIMEYVEGVSLAEAAVSGIFEPWPDFLLIFKNVCHHLVYSHNLPQGVLHRDVRPSNIMLPFAYWREEDAIEIGVSRYDVKLLNYDMSWHANAKGQAININVEEAGYHAPEQVRRDDEASRSTLVDSYGIGMSIFFAFSQATPPTGGSDTRDWEQIVRRQIKIDSHVPWRSACNRLRRIILQATAPLQENRISVTQIEAELELLSYAVIGKTDKLPIDFWAEELMCRAEGADYEALPDGYGFKRNPQPIRSISTQGDIKSNTVRLIFKNSYSGLNNRSGIDKAWSGKLETAKEILAANGWNVSTISRYVNREILLHAEISLSEIKDNFERVVQAFSRGLALVRID